MVLKQTILQGLNKGFNLVPTDNNKRPLLKWKNGVDVKQVEQLSSVGGIAIATGNDLELIDFDLKYDLTGDLYDRFKKEVKLYSQDLFDKIVVQTTVNKGFHWFYKCESLTDGNLKLARRESSKTEKEKGDKVKVLIETRGIGGYVMIYPTQGYKFIQGTIKTISYITLIERNYILSLARSYNSYREVSNDFKTPLNGTITPFDDYDEKVSGEQTIDLLKTNGWKEVLRSENRVSLLRPGDTKSKHSGYYELDKSRFSVFTTSSEFDPEQRYKNSAVYCILNHNGDWNAGAKELFKLGYGVQENTIEQPKVEITEDKINEYLESYKNIWSNVEDWYDGKIEIGLGTGMECVDYFFNYRKNALYTVTAITSVGKTTIVQYLQVLGSVKHRLKWLIYAAENSPDDYAEVLLGFYLKGNPKDFRQYDLEKYNEGKKFIEKHFYFLNNCKSLDTALNLAKIFHKKHDIYALFVDPINSVQPTDKIDSWDYPSTITAGRNVINFRKNYCSVWISQHPTIGKQRENTMPSTTDGEMGAWASKADVSIVLHRDKNAIDSNLTFMKIDKVRSKKLGCRITPEDHFINLNYNKYTFNLSAPKFNENGTVNRINYKNPM